MSSFTAMNFVEFFQRYVLVDFKVTTWSATRNNKPLDLGLENEALAADVVRLGSKSVFDKKKIAFQGRARQEGIALLSKVGFQVLGAWAVPRHLLNEVTDGLELMRVNFYANLDQLLLNYDAECDSWIQQAAATVSLHDFASRIRASLYDVDYVRKQVSFSYRVNEDVVNNPLGDAAVDTISEMARNSLRDFQYSMSNGSKFTRKSLRYVTNIKEKLIQMAVLDSFIQPAIDSIDAFESSLPKRRAAQLDATELSKMMGLLTLLSDPSYLSSLRTAKLEIEEEEDPTDAPSSVTASKDDFLTGMLAAISTTTNNPPPVVTGFY
ncbi:DUF3150 domain-containing protein (plasmid) [Aeromonas media]|uniref:DUF3150 domain-containing protein n=2 Tax=Aeromonas TaxID=642 RepID=A0ABX6NYP6_AERME|nr:MULTISPECIES: DUF3150 domain-containing protein [Aeromonas]ASI21291.1 hypothetical protein CE456_00080 [Aeromonas salmonicida]QJT41490.1 DUF3150 domain-containing protein [Aeromonas media]QLI59110.1 DUF3150 domain-containing protein [Aeromonas caviae]QLI60337.1 DUF3150 domain-containing protein [Aeromonas caviae]HDN9373692.1 DUF3150 domain-containing protein [Aeromonas salmonicida]